MASRMASRMAPRGYICIMYIYFKFLNYVLEDVVSSLDKYKYFPYQFIIIVVIKFFMKIIIFY